MNENHNSSTSRKPHLTKEQRLPNCYKEVEKIVKSVKSCESNFKTVLASSRLRGSQFKKVYKLSLNVLKYYNYIQKIIDKAEILVKEKFLRKEIASVLIYELIFGNGSLPGESKAVTTVQAYQNELMNIHQELQSHNTDFIDFNEICIPRYVRVHTLVTTVPYVIKDLENYGFKQIFYDEKTSEEMFFQLIKGLEKGSFLVDFHFNDILVFAQYENLIELDLYKNGHIFLQDKASYIPVHVLNPESGSTVLDACAAPGMKAAHIASKMKNKGILFACERDESRFETLKETMKYGAVKISKTLCTDFKLIDPNDEAYSAVEYILLDPSCSGSGMVHRMDKVTDTEDSKTKDRLTKLAGFQIILLKHALKFPSVKRVVYSTCSVHEEENEYVVHEALNAFDGTFQLVPVIPEWFDRGFQNYEFGKMCLRTVPEKHLTNGFFVAMFERIDTHEQTRKNFSAKNAKNKTNVRRSGSVPLEEVDLTHLKLKTIIKQEETSCEKNKMNETTEEYLTGSINKNNDHSSSSYKKKYDDNYQSLKQYKKIRNSGPLEMLHKTSESTENHDQNVDDMTYRSNTKKSKELIASELTKHQKREKKYITDIQSDKQNQKGLVYITSSELLQKSDNSQVLEKCSKMYKVANENSNTSPAEKKTKRKRLLTSENTDKNFENSKKIFSDYELNNKKRKKECSTSKSNSGVTEEGWDMHQRAGDTQNFDQNNFAEESKINSLESKPKKMKNSEFTLSCSTASNYSENKSTVGETVSSPTLTVKKNKKDKKHSKFSDIMASELHNLSACNLPESQYNSENFTLIKSAENLDNVPQTEMLKEQNPTDNFSKYKKKKHKYKKHGNKSSGSNETKNYSPDKNLNCSSTVELNKGTNKMVPIHPGVISIDSLNQDNCHVKKKKKKSKSDDTSDSANFLASNIDSLHDFNKILPRNEVESTVTPVMNDYIKRKKHKKHKKHTADDVHFIGDVKTKEGVKKENTARTVPNNSFSSEGESMNSSNTRKCNTGVTQEADDLSSQPNELENMLLSDCQVKKKKKKDKKSCSSYKEPN